MMYQCKGEKPGGQEDKGGEEEKHGGVRGQPEKRSGADSDHDHGASGQGDPNFHNSNSPRSATDGTEKGGESKAGNGHDPNNSDADPGASGEPDTGSKANGNGTDDGKDKDDGEVDENEPKEPTADWDGEDDEEAPKQGQPGNTKTDADDTVSGVGDPEFSATGNGDPDSGGNNILQAITGIAALAGQARQTHVNKDGDGGSGGDGEGASMMRLGDADAGGGDNEGATIEEVDRLGLTLRRRDGEGRKDRGGWGGVWDRIRGKKNGGNGKNYSNCEHQDLDPEDCKAKQEKFGLCHHADWDTYHKFMAKVCPCTCEMTRDGQLIRAPPHLPHFSVFFEHYTNAFPTETASGETSEPVEIPLNEIAGRHLRNIFSFFGRMQKEAPSDYQQALEGRANEITMIPDWAVSFFSAISSGDMIETMNAASFLGMPVFTDYALNYLVHKIEKSTVVEMRKFLSSESDFTRELGHQTTKEQAYTGVLRWVPAREDAVPPLVESTRPRAFGQPSFSSANTTY